jgi:hypothetical protein
MPRPRLFAKGSLAGQPRIDTREEIAKRRLESEERERLQKEEQKSDSAPELPLTTEKEAEEVEDGISVPLLGETVPQYVSRTGLELTNEVLGKLKDYLDQFPELFSDPSWRSLLQSPTTEDEMVENPNSGEVVMIPKVGESVEDFKKRARSRYPNWDYAKWRSDHYKNVRSKYGGNFSDPSWGGN